MWPSIELKVGQAINFCLVTHLWHKHEVLHNVDAMQYLYTQCTQEMPTAAASLNIHLGEKS